MKDDKINTEYTYDPPTGIVEKGGKMIRGMMDAEGRPLSVRIITIILSLFLFVFPGLLSTITSIFALFDAFGEDMGNLGILQFLLIFILSIVILICGISVIYRNIRTKTARASDSAKTP